MHAVLSTSHYFYQDIFALEQQRLFGRLRIFACLKTSIEADQAFATREVVRRSFLYWSIPMILGTDIGQRALFWSRAGSIQLK